MKVQHSYSGGITLGAVVAAILSWGVNHSIGWCIIHGMFGWWYVLYYMMGGGR